MIFRLSEISKKVEIILWDVFDFIIEGEVIWNFLFRPQGDHLIPGWITQFLFLGQVLLK